MATISSISPRRATPVRVSCIGRPYPCPPTDGLTCYRAVQRRTRLRERQASNQAWQTSSHQGPYRSPYLCSPALGASGILLPSGLAAAAPGRFFLASYRRRQEECVSRVTACVVGVLTKGLAPVSVPCCAPQVGEIRRVCIHHGNSMCGAT